MKVDLSFLTVPVSALYKREVALVLSKLDQTKSYSAEHIARAYLFGHARAVILGFMAGATIFALITMGIFLAFSS